MEKLKIGDWVTIKLPKYQDRYGRVQNIVLSNSLPVQVRLDGDNFETDFRFSEVELIVDKDIYDITGCDRCTNCRPHELRSY